MADDDKAKQPGKRAPKRSAKPKTGKASAGARKKPKLSKAEAKEREKAQIDEKAARQLQKIIDNIDEEAEALMGRPTEYQPVIGMKIVAIMSKGYSLTAAAGALGFSRQTFYNWEKKYPDFLDSVKRGMAARTYYLETGLIAAPDSPMVTSRIFALKNAAPAEWRDKVEVGVELEGELSQLISQLRNSRIMPKALIEGEVVDAEYTVVTPAVPAVRPQPPQQGGQ